LIGGIFFDEAWNICGPNNLYAEVYRLISDSTKRRHPGALTVLNPGDSMPQCFEERYVSGCGYNASFHRGKLTSCSADTLLTYESNYEGYFKDVYKDNGWKPKDSRKIWHIVHTTPADKVQEVTSLARKRGAGLVQITDAVMPNPYNKLPSEGFMNTLIQNVDSGKPYIEKSPQEGGGGAPPAPNSLEATESDYTSVKLKWSASGNPHAIAVYRFGEELIRIPGDMSAVVIGNLQTDFKGHQFRVRAIGANGSPSEFSNLVTKDTTALPGGKPIINVKIEQKGNEMVYEADVLIPYAFIRILVTDTDTDCNSPSYPVSTDDKFVCAHFMIEGSTAYSYAATAKDPVTGNWPWLWKATRVLDNDGNNMVVERDRYHYKWHFPIVSPAFDHTNIVVQGEGFNPRTDSFTPCPCRWESGDRVVTDPETHQMMFCEGKRGFCPYDCKGEGLCSISSVKWCDKGINQITADQADRKSKTYVSNAGYLAGSGNCWANAVGNGCSVQIRGTNRTDGNKNCVINGEDMWNTYQDIKNPLKGGCKKCGTKHFGDGCMVSIDYYTGCGNVDSGSLNRAIELEQDSDLHIK
jgi:hypothetical protein